MPEKSLVLDRRARRIAAEFPELDDDQHLKTRELAEILATSESWLENRRWLGADGPPFVRLSTRQVRYRWGDVRRWLDERAHGFEARHGGAHGK